MDTQKTTYYIDLIRINSRKSPNSLIETLPINHLEKSCHQFWIKEAYSKARDHGYPSRIEIVIPSSRALDHLSQHEKHLGQYSISRLEIAQDIDEYNSYLITRNKWKTLRKLRGGGKAFDGRSKEEIPSLSKGHWDFMTYYYGPQSFQLVSYARNSKTTGKPVTHYEWRMIGAQVINRKTGIRTVHDLTTFNAKDFFEQASRQYLVEERIDYFRLGLWFKGWDLRRRKLTEAETRRLYTQGSLFCRINSIYTPSELSSYFQQEKARIKSSGAGRKSLWDQKIKAVRVGKFLIRSLPPL